jgi:thiol:disulfide interchange protein DsbC
MRKTVFILVAVLFIFATCCIALSRDKHDKKAHDCANCHTLKNDEAAAVLKNMVPDVKILNISQSPVKGFWEVFLQSKGRQGLLYIDYSKKVFFSGAMFDIASQNNLTKTSAETLSRQHADLLKIDVSKIPLEDALVLGDKKAKYRIIVFSDPDCPYCGKLHEELKKVLEKRKDIVFFIKLYPLPMHPDAYWKSKSIVCKQSMQMLEDNFAHKKMEKVECATKTIDANIRLAGELGINGTPAMVLPGGNLVSGYREAGELIGLIAQK